MRGLLAAAALAVVAGVIVAGRLSQGPIDLAFLKPRLEHALGKTLGVSAEVGTVALDARDGRVLLSASDLHAVGDMGETIGRAARVNLGLDLRALMNGEVAPDRLEIFGARVQATRDPDGALSLRVAPVGDAAASGDLETSAPDILSLAREWMAGDRAVARLPDIRLAAAELSVVDGSSGDLLWRGEADATLQVWPDRAAVLAAIGFDDNRAAPRLQMSAALRRGDGGAASARLAHADLAAMGRVARLFGLDLPPIEGRVDGAASLEFGPSLQPTIAQSTLRLTSFDLALPDGARLALEHGEAEAEFDFASARLVLSGLRLGPEGAGFVGAGDVRFDGNAAHASGRIDHADIAYLAALIGNADALRGIDAALSGDVDASFAFGRIGAVEARLRARADIDRPDLFYNPLEVRDAVAFMRFDAGVGDVAIKGVNLTLDGIAVAGEAAAQIADDGTLDTLDAKVRVGELPAERLARIWPRAFSTGGRAWVARNLTAGRITGADAKIEKASGAPIAASGEFAAEDLTVRYWDPMPLATGVAGVGRFAGDELVIDVSRGASSGLTTDDVKIRFTDLGQPRETLSIDGAIAGSAPDLLAVLNRKPLQYADWLGVEPAATRGKVDGRVRLKFPLIDELSVDDIDIQASGAVAEAFLPKAVAGWDLDADRLKVDVDMKRLAVDGEGRLLKEPIRFAGALQFAPGPERARFKGDWRLTRTVRQELGIGAPAVRRRLTGVTPAAFDVRILENDRYEIDVDADLTAATLLAQEIGWLKPKGAPARVAGRAILQGRKPVRIEQIRLTADDFRLDADVDFDLADQSLRRVAVRRLKGAGHDLTADVVLEGPADMIVISGAAADLRPLLELEEEPNAKNAPPKPPDPRRRRFEIDLAEARLSKRLRLGDLTARFTIKDGWPETIDARARYQGGQLTVGKDPENADWLRADISDFGQLLAASGAIDGVRGEGATLYARNRADAGFDLTFEAEDFIVSRAGLADLLGGSSTGLVDTFAGKQGIRFDDLDLSGAFANGALRIAKGSLRGTAIGVTAKGDVDIGRRNFDVVGAITPVYGVSRMLSAIPLLGDILTGTDGAGLFAAQYRAFGSFEDPKLKVDRLSALAPGILRQALPAPKRSGDTPVLQPPGPPPNDR